MVSKPFARVIIRFGEAFEEKCLLIEQHMKDLYEGTDRIWADAGKIEAVFKNYIAKRSRQVGHCGCP